MKKVKKVKKQNEKPLPEKLKIKYSFASLWGCLKKSVRKFRKSVRNFKKSSKKVRKCLRKVWKTDWKVMKSVRKVKKEFSRNIRKARKSIRKVRKIVWKVRKSVKKAMKGSGKELWKLGMRQESQENKLKHENFVTTQIQQFYILIKQSQTCQNQQALSPMATPSRKAHCKHLSSPTHLYSYCLFRNIEFGLHQVWLYELSGNLHNQWIRTYANHELK